MSRANNGGKIIEWDWQRNGILGEKSDVYKRDIVNEDKYVLTQPGQAIFYLSVRNDGTPKTGCADPWSENGNHQVVGKNKWFHNGVYWYFTAIRIVVKPARDALVHVRCIDSDSKQVFHEETVSNGRFYESEQLIDTYYHIPDYKGYEFKDWNVQFMDGNVQYSGTERDVKVTLSAWVSEKYLNIEYRPYNQTDLEVRYWDKSENKIISKEHLVGEAVVGADETKIIADIKTPEGYKTDGWTVELPNGLIQYGGNSNPASITLSGNIPKKILNVNCYPLNGKKITVNYINSKTNEVIKTSVIKPNEEDAPSLTVEVELENVPGYMIENWTLKIPDGTIEKSGTEDMIEVTLTDKLPHKILDVSCFPFDGDEDDDPEDEPIEPPTITVRPGICNGIIEWTETDSHRIFVRYDSKGRRRYRTCRHTFEYRAYLDAEATITPDTLKSGYGFGVDVACTLDTELVSNDGCGDWGYGRSPAAIVRKPTTATVYVPWDMTNRLGSQGRSISMEQNGNLKFTLPESHVSETGAKKIYTPVELPGTKEEPRTHSFEIYIGGGGVDGTEFCQKIDASITINGDMYQDDVRPDRALL